MKQQICSGGFLIKDNKFLFGKRAETKSWAPGLWDIVGGHLKKNETPYDALVRETLEEIGVEVINAELITTMDVIDERYRVIIHSNIISTSLQNGKVKS